VKWQMNDTTSMDGFGTCEVHGKLRPKATMQLERCSTLCVMSWTCSSSTAAMTMMQVMEDMMRGSQTPKGWPRLSWQLILDGERVLLQLLRVPQGSQAAEGALELPF